VRLDGGDHKARQALAQYIAWAPLSLQKLTYDRPGGRVLCHTTYNPYFRQNTALWNATDFIAALTQFIPRAAAGCAADGGSPAMGRPLYPLLRLILFPMQGALGESAPRRPCRPGRLERLARCSAARHRRSLRDTNRSPARLTLSVGEADCESLRGRAPDLSSLRIEDEAHRGHHESC
jgi:hypothetical protein